MFKEKYNHWTGNKDDNDIVWLTLDRKDTSANTINEEVLVEFDKILAELEKDKPQALIILSGKKNGFIAGADITQFTNLKTEKEAIELIKRGQEIFTKLANVKYTTVALIHGFCLGGGFELALACDYRVALDDPKTKIGLPEVLLGIQPGWGGTVRLPKLVEPLKAIDLMLTGKSLSASKAKNLNIIDAAVPERHFKKAAEYYALKKPELKRAGFISKLQQLDFVRPLLGKIIKRKLDAKVNPKHYPAPFAILENWIKYNVNSTEKALAEEINGISRLLLTKTAKNLARVFFLREKLKGLAKNNKYHPKHIHIVGAGVMGGDIAAICALKGYRVTIEDKNIKAIGNTIKRANDLFTKKLKQNHLITAAKDRLMPDPEGLGVSIADVIIEAIIENVEAKQQLFASIEKEAKKDAILATNTSTITLDKIRENMQNKERLLGIHFFNPVEKMPLVEVVFDSITNEETKNKALSFVGSIDKLPLPVKSSPGFLVNRVLSPYFAESITLYEEGVSPTMIDKAATDFGMPIGPIELADTVGLDVCKAAGESLGLKMPKLIDNMISQNKLGKKSGEGFYKYKNGKPIKPKLPEGSTVPQDIQDRLMMRMINEAVACLREGVVENEDHLDAGMIFGAGFAPFLGGPMNYIESDDTINIKDKLEKLAKRYGERFEADKGWAA